MICNTSRALGAAAFLIGAAMMPATAADPIGTWATEGGRASVRIASCGATLCGTIISLKEPNDPATGKPKIDKNNSDAGKRTRPLVGTPIVMDLKPSSTTGRWDGRLYNAEDGKTYNASVTLTGASALKVEGCAMGGLACRAQTWTRTN